MRIMSECEFTAGRELQPTSFVLDRAMLDEYLAIVGAESSAYEDDYAPTTALAALGIRTLLSGFGLPEGAVHVSQELESHRAARVGESVSCHAKIVQSSQRGKGGRFIVFEFTIADDQSSPVLDGRTTLIVFGKDE